MKIIGFKKVDYVSKNDKQVQGWQLYLVNRISNGYGFGWFYNLDSPTRPVFVRDSVFAELGVSDYNSLVGADVDLFYNSFGNVVKIKFTVD